VPPGRPDAKKTRIALPARRGHCNFHRPQLKSRTGAAKSASASDCASFSSPPKCVSFLSREDRRPRAEGGEHFVRGRSSPLDRPRERGGGFQPPYNPFGPWVRFHPRGASVRGSCHQGRKNRDPALTRPTTISLWRRCQPEPRVRPPSPGRSGRPPAARLAGLPRHPPESFNKFACTWHRRSTTNVLFMARSFRLRHSI